ncbi:MAG: M50 family metallopeptidase [Polyangiaceae bacterium]
MLSFRLGNIPVRVHLVFFFMALMLGGGRPGPGLVSWVVVVFVSVLLHELGHALVGRAFGLAPEIDLHGMGGLTSWTSGPRLGPFPFILISLAGPLTGIVLGAIVWALAVRTPALSPMAAVVADQFVSVNVYWGILNLIPMLPLDGGNVMARVLDRLTGGRVEGGRRTFLGGARRRHRGFTSSRGADALAGDVGGLPGRPLATLFLVQNVRALMPPPAAPPTE